MADKKNYFKELYDVCVVINSSLEPEAVLRKIAEQLISAMQAKACSIRLLDQAGEVLEQRAAIGLSKGYIRKGKVELSKSQLDQDVLKSGKPLYIADVSRDSRFQYPEAAKAEGLTSMLVAPLVVDGKAIGVMRVYSAKQQDFSEEDREFLTAVTHLAAIAIENAMLHAALKKAFELQNTFSYQIFDD